LTKWGPPAVVTPRTKSRILFFVEPSFQEGRGACPGAYSPDAKIIGFVVVVIISIAFFGE
jgi:hypothetical protein